MDITDGYFLTIDMHRFALMWLVYSRKKISEWVQIFPKNIPLFRGYLSIEVNGRAVGIVCYIVGVCC